MKYRCCSEVEPKLPHNILEWSYKFDPRCELEANSLTEFPHLDWYPGHGMEKSACNLNLEIETHRK